MDIRRSAVRLANRALGPFGVSLEYRWSVFSNYIPLRQTERRAKEAGMAIGEYIDSKNNYPGATKETIERIAALGVFEKRIERVCEIGPGSGRYLEAVKDRCHPASYEVYETASDWKKRLVTLYGVTAHDADGKTLAQTPDRSVDLVHAHKVLEGLPLLVCLGYFREMIRIVRPGGWAFFDVLTEECLTPEITKSWLDSGWNWIVSMFPKQYIIGLFESEGFKYVGSVTLPMFPGKSEYLVLQRLK